MSVESGGEGEGGGGGGRGVLACQTDEVFFAKFATLFKNLQL